MCISPRRLCCPPLNQSLRNQVAEGPLVNFDKLPVVLGSPPAAAAPRKSDPTGRPFSAPQNSLCGAYCMAMSLDVRNNKIGAGIERNLVETVDVWGRFSSFAPHAFGSKTHRRSSAIHLPGSWLTKTTGPARRPALTGPAGLDPCHNSRLGGRVSEQLVPSRHCKSLLAGPQKCLDHLDTRDAESRRLIRAISGSAPDTHHPPRPQGRRMWLRASRLAAEWAEYQPSPHQPAATATGCFRKKTCPSTSRAGRAYPTYRARSKTPSPSPTPSCCLCVLQRSQSRPPGASSYPANLRPQRTPVPAPWTTSRSGRRTPRRRYPSTLRFTLSLTARRCISPPQPSCRQGNSSSPRHVLRCPSPSRLK
jgi:hypothetical protein